MAVIDPLDGTVLERANFDTHISQDESEEFARLIEWLEPGMIVVVAAMDDAAENLTDNARAACERLGSTMVKAIRYRDSWCLIGEKGAEKGSVPESHRSADKGPSDEIQRQIDLGQRRRTILMHAGKSGDKSATALSMLLPSQGRWLRRRKNDGALNRVPPKFYPKVWDVLSKTEGIVVGKQYLPANPTVYEKTAEELNFGGFSLISSLDE